MARDFRRAAIRAITGAERAADKRRVGRSGTRSAKQSGPAPPPPAADRLAQRRAAAAGSGRYDARRSPTARPGRAGRRSPLPAAAVSLFFEAVLLFGLGQSMARPRHLRAVLEPLQVVPA